MRETQSVGLQEREKKTNHEGGILFSWRRTTSRCLAFQVGVASSWGRRIRCNSDIIDVVSWLDLDGAKERRKVRRIIATAVAVLIIIIVIIH